jgi:hypothetical protein
MSTRPPDRRGYGGAEPDNAVRDVTAYEKVGRVSAPLQTLPGTEHSQKSLEINL